MDGRKKVLLVDDEKDVLDLFRDLFVSRGYDVECASSGIEALEFISKTRIDAVLLDVRMPIMDGIQTLASLRHKNPELAIVMFTAYGFDDNLVYKTRKLGASGFISKHLPLTQIISTFTDSI